MFPDIGGVELIIVAVVALLVVKPKDLPVMMRKVGEFMGKARRMASDFRASFEDMARQSELDDLRRQVEEMRSKATDPTGLSAALQETESDIQTSLSDPHFDYSGAQTEHVPWEEPVAEPPPAKKPARKRAASTTASAKTAPKAKAAPKRTAAKRATKTVS